MNARWERGRAIVEKGGQVKLIDAGHYTVKSQSGDGIHDVTATEAGWECTCPDYKNRHVYCMHIHAVEILTQINDMIRDDVEIPEVVIDSCVRCDSPNIKKNGIRHNKSGDVQTYKCKDCTRKFSGNLGFERMRATPEQITMAIDIYFGGESYRKAARSILILGAKKSHVAVLNWVKKYVKLMARYLVQIRPVVGESWRTDEVEISVGGEKKYHYAIIDSETRFCLAQMVADHKGNDDVRPMFRSAKKRAGKVTLQDDLRWRPQLSQCLGGRILSKELSAQTQHARPAHTHGRRHEQQPDGVV